MTVTEIGRVVELWRYPVKSMAGVRVEEIDVSWHGLVGDRRWAFVRPDMQRSGFPWLTIRELPAMSLYRPAFDDPERPNDSKLTVTTPSGSAYDVIDEALAAELGDGVRVIKQDVGVFDTMPLSLMTTNTIASLNALVEPSLEALRFRANLVVEATGDDPFPEDGWIGSALRIGGLAMRVNQRDARCVMITIDPHTNERHPAVLRTVAQQRAGCLGVYGATLEPGRVAVGDPVLLDA